MEKRIYVNKVTETKTAFRSASGSEIRFVIVGEKEIETGIIENGLCVMEKMSKEKGEYYVELTALMERTKLSEVRNMIKKCRKICKSGY